MLNVNLLKSEIAKNGTTQKDLAKAIGITECTFTRKLQRGSFGTDEAQKIIEVLKIENPTAIFFAKK